jgi:hypothetical protein
MSDSNGNIHQTSQRKLSRINHHSIHALIAAYFNLMSKLNGITAFSHHVDEVRRKCFSLKIIPKILLACLSLEYCCFEGKKSRTY